MLVPAKCATLPARQPSCSGRAPAHCVTGRRASDIGGAARPAYVGKSSVPACVGSGDCSASLFKVLYASGASRAHVRRKPQDLPRVVRLPPGAHTAVAVGGSGRTECRADMWSGFRGLAAGCLGLAGRTSSCADVGLGPRAHGRWGGATAHLEHQFVLTARPPAVPRFRWMIGETPEHAG